MAKKKKKKSRRTLFIVAFLVIGGVAAAVYALRPDASTGIEVDVAPVERTKIVQTVTATGRIQPKTQVSISADVSAKITRLAVDEGDSVKRGQFLVELDRKSYEASLESAQASLRVAQSNSQVTMENRNKAEKDIVRIRDLHAAGLETQAALDAAEATFQAEEARHRSTLDQVEQSRASLRQVHDALDKTRIFAPIAGTVSKLNKEVGEIALGSQFQEDVILEISNLSGMEALVDVDENDIVRISRGDSSSIEVDALPGTRLVGTVTEIASSAKISASGTTEQKTEFEVTIAIDAIESMLRPGMTATAEITTDVHDDAIAVPIQSVAVRTPKQLGVDEGKFEADGEGFVQVVFVVESRVVHARSVKTGIQSDSHIEILDGLSQGDSVVVGSYRAISKDLTDGAEAVVRRESSRSAEPAPAGAE